MLAARQNVVPSSTPPHLLICHPNKGAGCQPVAVAQQTTVCSIAQDLSIILASFEHGHINCYVAFALWLLVLFIVAELSLVADSGYGDELCERAAAVPTDGTQLSK